MHSLIAPLVTQLRAMIDSMIFSIEPHVMVHWWIGLELLRLNINVFGSSFNLMVLQVMIWTSVTVIAMTSFLFWVFCILLVLHYLCKLHRTLYCSIYIYSGIKYVSYHLTSDWLITLFYIHSSENLHIIFEKVCFLLLNTYFQWIPPVCIGVWINSVNADLIWFLVLIT